MIGYINGYDKEQGILSIIVPDYFEADKLEEQAISQCEVILKDGRSITPQQRRKIFATIRDISEFISGYSEKRNVISETLCAMELNYLIDLSDSESVRFALTNQYCALSGIDLFSLSDKSNNSIDCTTASDFIDWLINICIENAIPCSESLLNRAEDIGRYVYACLANRRCAICGAKADIHHVDQVGMGRNRREIVHEGMDVLPLCRIHHTEAHTIGKNTFMEKYHLQGVKLDKHLCRVLKLRESSEESAG